MTLSLFSATGCVRCKVVKEVLAQRGIPFEDQDALGEGKEVFRTFYRENRQKVYRGPEGIEFPIIVDGGVIRQGLAPALGRIMGGPALEGFFRIGILHGQWVDGIHLSGGDPAQGESLFEILSWLKDKGFKLQIETNGLHAHLLKEVLEKGLAHRVIMEVKGPLALYDQILGQKIETEDIMKSLALVGAFGERSFFTVIGPVVRGTDNPPHISYITPEEVAETAHLIHKGTGDNRQPYFLCRFDPKGATDQRLKDVEPLPEKALFRYRTLARRHQVKTEIGSIPLPP